MIIPATIGGVRTIRHSPTRFSLIRKPSDPEVLRKLDNEFVRCGRQLMWSIPMKDTQTIEGVRDVFEKKVCYVVGKGASLDFIKADDFPHEDAPIICINESIHAVEELKIPNPIFMLQQDKSLRDTCKPKRSKIFLSTHNTALYSNVPPEFKIIYVPEQLGCHESSISAEVAIKIATRLGAIELRLLAFDGCVEKKNTRYATRIGYSSRKGGSVKRFYQIHREILLLASGRVPAYFCQINRCPLTGATEQQLLDNHQSQNAEIWPDE